MTTHLRVTNPALTPPYLTRRYGTYRTEPLTSAAVGVPSKRPRHPGPAWARRLRRSLAGPPAERAPGAPCAPAAQCQGRAVRRADRTVSNTPGDRSSG
eukprot:758862-Hanusia_phi.AAC.2